MDPSITLSVASEEALYLGSTVRDNFGYYAIVDTRSIDSLTTEFRLSNRLVRALHKAGFELAPVDDNGQIVRTALGLSPNSLGDGIYLLHERVYGPTRASGVLATRPMLEDFRERLIGGELDVLLDRPRPNPGKTTILRHPITRMVA
jgi:hypothetical protein